MINVSGFSPTAGKKTAGQIEKETLKNRITNDHRSMIMPCDMLPSVKSGLELNRG